jgi:hypothetical protein
MAVLELSVPPEVKNISAGCALSSLATVFRAVSMASRLSLPYEYIEDGFPNFSVR